MENHYLFVRFSKLVEHLEHKKTQVFMRESEIVFFNFIKELGHALFCLKERSNHTTISHDKSLDDLIRLTQNDLEFLHGRIIARIDDDTRNILRKDSIQGLKV